MKQRMVVAAIQARMGSTRLPGKVLLNLQGKTVLDHIVERLRTCRNIDLLTIATSMKMENRAISEVALRNRVACVAGAEHDCLNRFLHVGSVTDASVLVRVTADCPLVDPVLTDTLIEELLSNNLDYIAGGPGLPRGVTSEVFSMNALTRADRVARAPYEREHVTIHLYEHPDWFRVAFMRAPDQLFRPAYRLTLDTPEDWKLLQALYERLYVPGSIVDTRKIIQLLDESPELVSINAHVEQKDPHASPAYAA
jgi:spore coat polysaccharide biosynthesis protein SpsF